MNHIGLIIEANTIYWQEIWIIQLSINLINLSIVYFNEEASLNISSIT